jgi:hypothetical protein
MPVYLVIEGVSSNKQEGEGEKKKGKIELSEIASTSTISSRGRLRHADLSRIFVPLRPRVSARMNWSVSVVRF